MPAITAILHTKDDALRLGRALEMLLPCDEILVIDHDSHDVTQRVARQYGARIVPAVSSSMHWYLARAAYDWILCLQATESISDRLQTTLYEWKMIGPEKLGEAPAFSMLVREETVGGWVNHPAPETRLVPRRWDRWHGRMPANDPSATMLEGELLRFALP